MLGNDRHQLRSMFTEAWQRQQRGLPLDALQQVIVNIIALHPEYHGAVTDPDALEQDYNPETGETNPFLHMSMHIALHEQISTDRPTGITSCYKDLCTALGSDHEAEHAMMECLGEALWEAQRSHRMPDEAAYLGCIKKLLNEGIKPA